MNSITKKIILPMLFAGSTLMYGCGKETDHKVNSVIMRGINIEGIINTDGVIFSDRDGKPGFDAIIGKGGYSWIYFCKEKWSNEENDYGVVMSDSTQKYMKRLQEDLQKIEEFTKKDYELAMKNK